MKLEKAIEILESGSWSGYDDEEIAEAVRMGAEALRETERNPTITSWHDFDRGYNIAKEKFSRPHGEWQGNTERRNMVTRICTSCGIRSVVGCFCMWCGADMRMKEGEKNEHD